MKCYILAGSPRKKGNTASLLTPFMEELSAQGAEYEVVQLQDQTILPCMACRECQRDWAGFGCVYDDDMHEVFDKILSADMIVLATPIYAWFCTAPMKLVLDRLVYGMNKYYDVPEDDGDGRIIESKKGPALWAGKKMALIMTCGYRPEKGTDLFQTGMERYCKHSQMEFAGAMSERHMGYDQTFMDEEKEARARAFARTLCGV